jgi:rod shape-determining protein MreC
MTIRKTVLPFIMILIIGGIVYCGDIFLYKVASCFVYPVLRIYYYCAQTAQRTKCTLDERARQEQEIIHLRYERDQARAQAAVTRALCSFSAKTRYLEDFRARCGYKKARITSIVYRSCTPQEQYMLIDAGEYHGIRKGMIAVDGDVLLGKVTDVYVWYSKVVLITDALCHIAVTLPRSGAQGIYIGQNSTESACVIHVSHLDTVIQGDYVVSSGQGTVFPAGFVLGTVTSCSKGALFYEIAVTPLSPITAAHYCLILPRESPELTNDDDAIHMSQKKK